MDTVQFLARVVAPGNYLAVCHKGADARAFMNTRFFPRDNISDAAGYMNWCVQRDMDVWYCPASFRMASPHSNKPNAFTGERKQTNVQALKCFWYDADVKRTGDKKPSDSVFLSQVDVFHWVKALREKTGIMRPNLVVSSGYGVHLYWVLEDAMAPEAWLPRARAFRALLESAGAVGDLGITIDSARLLRPPGTKNFKVPDSPTDVVVL
jgi:hypothetical protein